MTWSDLIERAFLNLGGESGYPVLYSEVGRLKGRQLSRIDKATVRKEIERKSSDSDIWQGKEDLFRSVGGKGSGIWGLKRLKNS